MTDATHRRRQRRQRRHRRLVAPPVSTRVTEIVVSEVDTVLISTGRCDADIHVSSLYLRPRSPSDSTANVTNTYDSWRNQFDKIDETVILHELDWLLTIFKYGSTILDRDSI